MPLYILGIVVILATAGLVVWRSRSISNDRKRQEEDSSR